jgi:hypothetical protein
MAKHQLAYKTAIRSDYVCASHIFKFPRPNSRQTLPKVSISGNLDVLPKQQHARNENSD